MGRGSKTSNLSLRPVPLVVKLNVKCRGDSRVETVKQNLVQSGQIDSKAYGSRGSISPSHTRVTNPPLPVFLVMTHGTGGVITTAGAI